MGRLVSFESPTQAAHTAISSVSAWSSECVNARGHFARERVYGHVRHQSENPEVGR